MTFIPVPGTLDTICTPVSQYPGYGYALLNIPECRYGYGYNICLPARNFYEFKKPPIPVPGTFYQFCNTCFPFGGGVTQG